MTSDRAGDIPAAVDSSEDRVVQAWESCRTAFKV